MNDNTQYLSDQFPKVGRVLDILLLVMTVLLSIAIIVMVLSALIMLFDNQFRNELLLRVTDGGDELTPYMMGLAALAGAVVTFAYLFVVNILRKVVRSLRNGDPFIPENISRLRRIWIIIASAEVFRMFCSALLPILLRIEGQETENLVDIRLATWFLVFVIMALAEVFRHGAELRQDQKLTV